MHGLTVRELQGEVAGEAFHERLARVELEAFPSPRDPPDLVGYVELALRSGAPRPWIAVR